VAQLLLVAVVDVDAACDIDALFAVTMRIGAILSRFLSNRKVRIVADLGCRIGDCPQSCLQQIQANHRLNFLFQIQDLNVVTAVNAALIAAVIAAAAAVNGYYKLLIWNFILHVQL